MNTPVCFAVLKARTLPMRAAAACLTHGIALFVALGSSGCGTQQTSTQVAATTGVGSPDSPGACAFDLSTDSKADTVFFVLGMLDEYLGRRFVEGGDAVEGFYCNERKIADVFGTYLTRLATEQKLSQTPRAETVQECLTRFHSKPIAAG